MVVNEILRDTDGKRKEKEGERDHACKLFYYFSSASSGKHETHFLQGKLRARSAVIKNTIEIYLAEEPVLLLCE